MGPVAHNFFGWLKKRRLIFAPGSVSGLCANGARMVGMDILPRRNRRGSVSIAVGDSNLVVKHEQEVQETPVRKPACKPGGLPHQYLAVTKRLSSIEIRSLAVAAQFAVRLTVFVLAMLLPMGLHAAVDGTVVNRTTGKPQPGISIALVKPSGQGMQTIGTAETDAQGRFRFEKDQPGGAPQLLQATYSGVTYNKLLTPNVPTSGVEVDVYDATKSAAVAEFGLHMVIMEASESQLTVNEVVTVRNQGNVTYEDPEQGGLRFFLPPATNGQVRIDATGPQGMPLRRSAEPTGQRNVFKVAFPIKPGETEFKLSYVIPVGSPTTYTGRVVTLKGQGAPGPIRFVVPQGMTLEGKDLTALGQEPTTQASIYNLRATGDYSINVSGTGSLQTGEQGGGENESPPIEQVHPRLYNYLPWLVTLSFAILATGLVLLYRISPVVERPKK